MKVNPDEAGLYDQMGLGHQLERNFPDAIECGHRAVDLVNDRPEYLNNLGASYSAAGNPRKAKKWLKKALAVQPDIILMDEPTSALDPIATAKIEELIDSLKADYSISIVTHSMQQAGRISDKTAFFLMGELVEFGNTEMIFSNPRDKRTEDYISGRFGLS